MHSVSSPFALKTKTLRWLETILLERYGHLFLLSLQEESIIMTLTGAEGAICFDTLQTVFGEARSDFPCGQWDAEAEGWQAIFGKSLPTPAAAVPSLPLVEQNKSGYTIHYDILGLTYWMLARIEEIGRRDLDAHGRFPAASSHAYKHGYLERPVVDEWLNILGQVIQVTWPQLKLKQHPFKIKVSHDVDRPSYGAFLSLFRMIKLFIHYIVIKRSLYNALKVLSVKFSTRKELSKKDPYNTFDWIMTQSEKYGIISTFNFICGKTCNAYDADYTLDNSIICNLLKIIHCRGHEIGLHPSYNTFKEKSLIEKEFTTLKKICRREGVHQKKWDARMHYLRLEQPTTIRLLDSVGLDYDNTLTYADMPGFRCGTCFEYPAINPVSMKRLSIRIRPLIVMECSVLSSEYLGYENQALAFEKIKKLIDGCRLVGGVFTILWHNNNLESQADKNLYCKILEYGIHR